MTEAWVHVGACASGPTSQLLGWIADDKSAG